MARYDAFLLRIWHTGEGTERRWAIRLDSLEPLAAHLAAVLPTKAGGQHGGGRTAGRKREARWRVTGGAGAADAPSGVVAEFRLPASSTPWDITSGSDGDLWFTDYTAGMIGRMSVRGTGTRFALPSDKSGPWGIAAGSDGNLWFTEADDKVGRITPGGTITEFRVPDSGEVPDITAAPDGNLWFTLAIGGEIGRITPTGRITLFHLDAPQRCSGIDLEGIAAGRGGDLWFTEPSDSRIGHISLRGKSVDLPMPAPGYPSAIVAGPDGNLWCVGTEDDVIWRISPHGVFTRFVIW